MTDVVDEKVNVHEKKKSKIENAKLFSRHDLNYKVTSEALIIMRQRRTFFSAKKIMK